MSIIVDINKQKPPASVGNKAFNLHKLSRIGINIPKTYAITWEAYRRYINDDTSLIEDLRTELAKILQPDRSYAVRSSANIEDSTDRSFAGQFKSVLHVQGVDNVLQAAWSIWSSAHTPAVRAYMEKHGSLPAGLAMGVILQEMVMPVYSGVALSVNPVTHGDEVVVEAVKGDGTKLVQSGVTPDRWISKLGYWVEKAGVTDVSLDLVQEIVATTKLIARKFRHSVDLEWVYDGKGLYWVQVRAITTLKNRNVYSNYIPREMLPGMIKPLIFSVNIPLVNSVWINWMSELTGDLGLKPEDLAKSFYYRVYFNMGALGDIFEGLGFPRESVEMIMGSLPRGAVKHSFKPSAKTFSRLPWLFRFILDKWTFDSKMQRALPKLEERIRATPYRGLDRWSETDLLRAVDRHYTLMQEVAYYNVMGPLLMGMYNNVLKYQLNKLNIDFINFDLTEGMDEILEHDPATHLRRLNAEFCMLPPDVQRTIRQVSYAEFQSLQVAGDFPKKINSFVEKFGHLSDNGNDFSAIPWRERPEMVLQLVMDFETAREDGKKTTLSNLNAGGGVGVLFRFFYKRARKFRLLREQVSSLYTLGYGLFRYYFLALGGRFVNRGLIEMEEDVFYLTFNQVRGLVNGQAPTGDLGIEILKHKADMERFKDILIPTIIYGDEIPPVREPNMDVLTGIPTSIGHYTGKVKVVRGIQDFSKVNHGDVLVIPYSDVGWTPLFARAGAVVAESGGLLSHSSIVAREYNIPAVVSVEGATRIPDEITVTVDGHKGEVLIHK